MNIEELLAVGNVPYIMVRFGPGEGDALPIDARSFALRKEELAKFCRSIPNADQGLSWKLLKAHTNNNGMMAKLLIALGELAGREEVLGTCCHG